MEYLRVQFITRYNRDQPTIEHICCQAQAACKAWLTLTNEFPALLPPDQHNALVTKVTITLSLFERRPLAESFVRCCPELAYAILTGDASFLELVQEDWKDFVDAMNYPDYDPALKLTLEARSILIASWAEVIAPMILLVDQHAKLNTLALARFRDLCALYVKNYTVFSD